MNKLVFISGSNRGIGFETMTLFAEKKYDIIAHARKETFEIKENIERISQQFGVKIYPVYFDMTDYETMNSEIQKLKKEKLIPDVLINNAGIAHGGLFQMTKIDDIKRVFEINFFSHLQITQLFLRNMVRRNSGVIINLASIAGIDLEEGNCAYGCSKSAVIAWTKTLAQELGQYNIRVNAVAPGLTDTAMAEQMKNDTGTRMVESSAMKRLGKPSEIANVIYFLASDEASFINGQVLRIDGGSK